jgi:FKBP-type peptidyl-prolyl cis-trans isomerase SlyD
MQLIITFLFKRLIKRGETLMQKGEIVLVNYTGKDTNTGKTIETTREETAKKEGIFNEKLIYKPMPIAVGKGEIIKGIDEALEQMKEGEERTLEVKPEKGFGERKSELVRVFPLMEFKKRNIQPFPGLIVDVDELRGRVQTVSGGRVRVDFNHELAGRTLEYKLKVEKIVKEKKEKIEVLFEKYFPFVKDQKIELKEGIVEVSIPARFSAQSAALKPHYSEKILEVVEGIKKVKFVEEFEAKKEAKQVEEKKEEKEKKE